MDKQLVEHITQEVTDFLGYEPTTDDVDGILSNVLLDMDERINEYIEHIERNDDNMVKRHKIERIIKQSNDVDEMMEQLFWMDCTVVDDGQWIIDMNEDKIYGHTLPYFRTIFDLMGYKDFRLYHETDQELIDTLEGF